MLSACKGGNADVKCKCLNFAIRLSEDLSLISKQINYIYRNQSLKYVLSLILIVRKGSVIFFLHNQILEICPSSQIFDHVCPVKKLLIGLERGGKKVWAWTAAHTVGLNSCTRAMDLVSHK